MTQSLVDYLIIFPQKKATLTLPLHENKSHLLFRKLKLLAIRLSAKQWEIEIFQRKLWTSSVSPGETTTSRYEGVLRKWKNYCSQRDVDPLVTDVKNVLDFIHGKYKRGCRYSDNDTVAQPQVHSLVL